MDKEDVSAAKDESKCRHCGKGGHYFAKRKYREFRCRVSNGVGHLARVCVKTESKSKSHFVEADEGDTSNLDYIDMLHLSDISVFKPIMIGVRVDGKELKMKVDSGAGIWIFPERVFTEKLGKYKIKSTKVVV